MTAALPFGLPVDRVGFFAFLNQALQSARPGSAPALLLLDFPGLHEAGAAAPALLEAAARRLAAALGQSGFVSVQRSGRLAVLVESDGPGTTSAWATRLLGSLATPVVADGAVLAPGATIGSADWDPEGATADELFVAADQALCSARMQAEAVAAAGEPARLVFGPSPLRKAG